MTIIPVILAGGLGSRLWPLSRQMHPKPFLRLHDRQSLIQKTYLRAASIKGVQEIITVTNRELFFYTKDEYQELHIASVFNSFILEPCGRNSAPAIALAAHYVQSKFGNDAVLLILPADHLVEKQDVFHQAVDEAVSLADQGSLVTFGIRPDSPKTGYGYIEAADCKVLRFVEKPDVETAEAYVASGRYYWNSGMFCMHAGVFLGEMLTYCPEILWQTQTCLRQAKIIQGESWSQTEILLSCFEQVQNISVDYAVFERSDKVAVVPCDIGWSDIGSWLEFGRLYQQDDQANHIYGTTVLEEVKNCIIHSEDKMIAGLGLTNLIIVDTSDALLVANQDQAQNIGLLVNKLKRQQHKTYKFFPKVYRPWGNYTILQEGSGFKLKRIEVKPKASLSLQSHKHRSEHWVVVSGIAKVTNGDQIIQLKSNQSTYIPAGEKHRLENPHTVLLILIEVQCGSYLDEDDIVRYEDAYQRISF